MDVAICKKCVMPSSSPWVTLSDDGVCNLCLQQEKEKLERGNAPEEKLLETDLLKIFNKHKGKHRYDCLVMCSGGKDSTSALYFIKKRYKLNPLAFTFDHGFETPEALDNIHRAVDILGVDFLFYKTASIQPVFKKILETDSKAVICHLCSMWYMQTTYDVAARYDIPIIVAGWTKGQSLRQPVMSKCACNVSAPEFQAMGLETKKFLETHLKNDPDFKDFPSSMEEVLVRAKKEHETMVISPHWFLPFDQETYVEMIKNELQWKQPLMSYPAGSTNCALNFLAVHNSLKHFGYTHYHVEMSKLVREGLMDRESALKALEFNYDLNFLNSISRKLDYEFK